MAGVTSLVKGFQSLISTSSRIVDTASHFETVQTELGTVLQDVEKGKELFEDLRKFSFDTTFGVDELASASTQLLNVGESAENLKEQLAMIGDLAGGNKQKFAELTSIYTKVLAQGKAGAEQLNQINLRGIPISKTLKEMGVTGTATAKDLTNAFKKLTDEGGQFHGAMSNIIDTIEGKRGFITDTFNEVLVNFGELSGITDTYKAILDTVYTVLNALNEKLKEWNSDPLTKALLQGALVGAVTAIGTTIITMLIPAIKKVISHLITMNILQGPKGWAVLAVAGITSATTALITYGKEQEKIADNIEKTKQKQEELNKTLTTSQKMAMPTTEDSYKKALENVEYFQTKRVELVNQLNDLKAKQSAEQIVVDNSLMPTTYLDTLNEQISEVYENIERIDRILKSPQGIVEQYSTTDALTQKYTELNAVFKDVKSSMSEMQDYSAIQKQLDLIEELKDMEGKQIFKNGSVTLIKFDDKQKLEIDKTVDYLQKKIIESKIFNGEKITWQEGFKYTTGIDASKGGKSAGNDYYNQTISNVNKSLTSLNNLQNLLGVSYKDEMKSVLEDAKKEVETQLKELFNFDNIDDAFSSTDNTVQGMVATYKELDEKSKALGVTFDENKDFFTEWTTNLMDSGDIGQQFVGNLASSLSQYSQDLQNFSQGFQGGFIWGGIIATVVGAIASVASECEGFEEVMNPITTAMQELKPVIQWIVNILYVFVKLGNTVFAGISSIFQALEPIFTQLLESLNALRVVFNVITMLLQNLSPIIKGIASVLTAIIDFLTFGLINTLSDAADTTDRYVNTINDATTAEEEKTQEMIDQYNSLLSAMQEQEEWYLENKKALNAESRINSLTSVNDMILTPQGQFSTHPDDYIIATKNPNSLGSSGATVNFTVNNNASDVVQVSAQKQQNSDGTMDMVVMISKAIASDVMNGANGWDTALSARDTRLKGRRVSL